MKIFCAASKQFEHCTARSCLPQRKRIQLCDRLFDVNDEFVLKGLGDRVMATFLLEVGTEELPASFVASAINQWRSRIPADLKEQFLDPSDIMY